MLEYADILNKVDANERKGHYGNTTGMTVNDMYKNYQAWFSAKYPSPAIPLSFREWLRWAQNKGLIKPKVMKVEGDESNQDLSSSDAENTEIVLPMRFNKPTNRTGKILAGTILFVSLAFLIYNIWRKKPILSITPS